MASPSIPGLIRSSIIKTKSGAFAGSHSAGLGGSFTGLVTFVAGLGIQVRARGEEAGMPRILSDLLRGGCGLCTGAGGCGG